MASELTWHDVLAEEKQQPYFNTLQTVASERQSGDGYLLTPQKDARCVPLYRVG
ncbi:hypothetical protein ACLB1E_14685 [Escherichia coli]